MKVASAERTALGGKLRTARRYLGFARREVAAHLGVSPRSLAAIERGRRAATAVELERLERLYELDLERFDPDRPRADRVPLSPSVCERDRAELRRFDAYLRAWRRDVRKP